MGQNWYYLAKKAYFGPNLAVFGTKFLIFMGVSKSFGTDITEKPPRHLVCIVFWSGMGPNGPKIPIFGPKWPQMHILGQIWPVLGQLDKKLWMSRNVFFFLCFKFSGTVNQIVACICPTKSVYAWLCCRILPAEKLHLKSYKIELQNLQHCYKY